MRTTLHVRDVRYAEFHALGHDEGSQSDPFATFEYGDSEHTITVFLTPHDMARLCRQACEVVERFEEARAALARAEGRS